LHAVKLEKSGGKNKPLNITVLRHFEIPGYHPELVEGLSNAPWVLSSWLQIFTDYSFHRLHLRCCRFRPMSLSCKQRMGRSAYLQHFMRSSVKIGGTIGGNLWPVPRRRQNQTKSKTHPAKF